MFHVGELRAGQVGGCKPGDESHSLIWDAVSICLIFLGVHLRTRFQLSDFRLQLGFLGCEALFKGVGNRSATLHDTTSLLTGPDRRVCKSDSNMPTPGRWFPSGHKPPKT